MHSISNSFFSVLFLHIRQGTSEFPDYAFQEGRYVFLKGSFVAFLA